MINKRTLRDLNLAKTTALPAAGATANSASIDTAFENPGRIAEGPELLVELPATPSLADTKSITLTVQDSADNVTFAAVADLPVITVGPAAGGTGGAAVERQFKLPIGARRYLRLAAAVEAAGGANSAISSTVSVVF